MVENLKSKTLYKIGLILLKTVPMIMAFLSLLNSILSYFDIDSAIFSYLGSVSILTLIFLYLSSYIFRFCGYHRMFLHYIVVTWVINIYDYYCVIPLDDLNYMCLQMIVAAISLFIILYLYVKGHKKPIAENNR